MPQDSRIVYGAMCLWWDSIDKVSKTPTGLPCCPHCGGVLFEMASLEEWNQTVDTFEKESPSPGYREFINWLRGKCFPTPTAAREAYRKVN